MWSGRCGGVDLTSLALVYSSVEFQEQEGYTRSSLKLSLVLWACSSKDGIVLRTEPDYFPLISTEIMGDGENSFMKWVNRMLINGLQEILTF